MKEFKIFVEGDADVKFLHDYLEHILKLPLEPLTSKKGHLTSDQFTCTNGWTQIHDNSENENSLCQTLKRNTDNDGGINLIIFDADEDFPTRQQEILSWKQKYGVDFELFLFPSNKGNGNLECLLEQVINPQNQTILNCWSKLEDCLRSNTSCTKQPLTIPAKKSKIYMYSEVLHGESNAEREKIKDRNRDFKNKDLWDLDSPALNPLKDFLLQHCK